jgi:hypothetical protein
MTKPLIRPTLALALALALAASLGACHTARPLGVHQSCSRLARYARPRGDQDAEQIAKRMLTDVFGAPGVLAEEPFTSHRDQDRWIIRGADRPGGGPPMLVVIDTLSGCPVFVGRDQ